MPKEELLKYGAPLYGVGWAGNFAYMCGGGNLGIENKIVVVTTNKRGQLSEEVTKLNVGGDAPYRMAMHPSGRAIALGLTLGGLLRVTISPPTSPDQPPTILLSNDGVDSTRFKPIKSLSFSEDGRYLAIGGEDGTVEIVSWPTLDRIAYWQASDNKAIRHVDYSDAHAEPVLFTVDESGACKAWDGTTGEYIMQLQAPSDMPRATFFRCKAVVDEDGVALYAALKFKSKGYILRYRQNKQGRVFLEGRTKRPVTPSPICGLDISHCGRLLAAVTPDGDQCVISASELKVVKYRKGAHMTFATAVAFSEDDKAILSTSADASATLTKLGSIDGGSSSGFIGFLAFLFAILAVLVGLLRYWVQLEPELATQQLQWLPIAVREILFS